MPDGWRIIGLAESGLTAMFPPRKYLVENLRTKERRVVLAWDEDAVGSAIAKGQFCD